MRLIDLLIGAGNRQIDMVDALLAVGASVLYGYLTKPRQIDIDAWREHGSFNGIDLLCVIGAQHEEAP